MSPLNLMSLGVPQMESLETIGRKDVVRDNVRNPPAFYLGIIRRTAERMAGAPPASAGGPGSSGPGPRRVVGTCHSSRASRQYQRRMQRPDCTSV